jgi:hypothetical protein
MSAVLLLAHCVLPHDEVGRPWACTRLEPAVVEHVREVAWARLEALQVTDAGKISTAVQESWGNPAEWADPEGEDEPVARGAHTAYQRAQVGLADFLDLVMPDEEGVYGPSADMATILYFENKPWLFVADVSWGDVASDEGTLADFIGYLELFNEPIPHL